MLIAEGNSFMYAEPVGDAMEHALHITCRMKHAKQVATRWHHHHVVALCTSSFPAPQLGPS